MNIGKLNFIVFIFIIFLGGGCSRQVDEQALPFSREDFSFNSSEINEFMEQLFAPLFKNCAMYAAAYDVDLLIFSGKPSELPYIRSMAKRYIPIDDTRIIFARDFKPGDWYPFIDKNGYIQDAKTVTVVGSALYYALSNGFISGWKINTVKNISERNEWGLLESMTSPTKDILLEKGDDTIQVQLLPNTIIARRQNKCSSPEPVYKFIRKNNNSNQLIDIELKRKVTEDGDSLVLSKVAIDGQDEDIENYELKLWPCENANGTNIINPTNF